MLSAHSDTGDTSNDNLDTCVSTRERHVILSLLGCLSLAAADNTAQVLLR